MIPSCKSLEKDDKEVHVAEKVPQPDIPLSKEISNLLANPRSPSDYLKLSRHLAYHYPDDAKKFSRWVAQLEPIQAELWTADSYRQQNEKSLEARHRALSFERGGQFKEAENVLLESVRQSNPGSKIYLVEFYVRNQWAKKALKILESFKLENNASHPDYLGWKALALSQLDQSDEAELILTELIRKDKSIFKAWAPRLAKIFLEQQKTPKKALEILSVYNSHYTSPSANLMLAQSNFELHRYTQAFTGYSTVQQFQELNPEHEIRLLKTGWILQDHPITFNTEIERHLNAHPMNEEVVQLTLDYLKVHKNSFSSEPFNGKTTEELTSIFTKRKSQIKRIKRRIKNSLLIVNEEEHSLRQKELIKISKWFEELKQPKEALKYTQLACSIERGDDSGWRRVLELRNKPEDLFFQIEAKRQIPSIATPTVDDILNRWPKLLPPKDLNEKPIPIDSPITLKERVEKLERSGLILHETNELKFNFVDVSSDSQIDYKSICGSLDKNYIIEMNGSGVALLDYDLDGKLDVFLPNGLEIDNSGFPIPKKDLSVSDRLYKNLGNLKFKDVTEEAGILDGSYSMGVTSADYDNDGDPDLYINRLGPNRLLQNNGDGTFTDVSEKSRTHDGRWSTSSAFVDYDLDGKLDLFVVNYLIFNPNFISKRGEDPNCQYKGIPIACGPRGLPAVYNALYRNLGDGTFEDVSLNSGISSIDLKTQGYGLGVTVLDSNQDGWPDIYVANDSRANHLFINQRDGTFKELGLISGVALSSEGIAQAGMGVDSVYLKDDVGKESLFVTNFSNDKNTFYKANHQNFYVDASLKYGFEDSGFLELAWGTFFLDVNHDRVQDVFIANGHLVPQVDQKAGFNETYKQKNFLISRTFSSTTFFDVSEFAGPGFKVQKSSRGAAYGDLDNDGDLDIIINNIDDSITLLENKNSTRNNWLSIKLQGKQSNRDGIGAVVTLEADGFIQKRRIKSGSSYASQSELVAHFGLGKSKKVRWVKVQWPFKGLLNEEQVYSVDSVNRKILLVEK